MSGVPVINGDEDVKLLFELVKKDRNNLIQKQIDNALLSYQVCDIVFQKYGL